MSYRDIIPVVVHLKSKSADALHGVLRWIMRDTEDERLARTVTDSCIELKTLHKNHMPVITAMDIQNPAVRALVHTIKYHGDRESIRTASTLLSPPIAELCARFKIDILTAIPLSQNRKHARGFNQVDLVLAHCASLQPHLSHIFTSTVLKRTRDTRPQTKLGRDERIKNMSQAFVCTEDVRGKKILVVDDVVTTGATISSAALALKEAGADVYLFAIAGR